ncbi:conserved hypothetical protein [Hyphomicrobiales bacterium]|nr:conserved hypothetical protein [Hyphomicrobiales bacterium]CAH1675369.1 conserved hypothetical protein [Hyphomicrobiales bacterium]
MDLADRFEDRISIAAGLMGCSEEEVREQAIAFKATVTRPRLSISVPQASSPRSRTMAPRREVIVERVRPRMIMR